MAVVWTRIATPVPGKQAEAFEFAKKRAAAVNAAYGTQVEVHVRFGGPLGQVAMISRHKNVQEIEDIKRKVIEDSSNSKIPSSDGTLLTSVEDAIWLTK